MIHVQLSHSHMTNVDVERDGEIPELYSEGGGEGDRGQIGQDDRRERKETRDTCNERVCRHSDIYQVAACSMLLLTSPPAIPIVLPFDTR